MGSLSFLTRQVLHSPPAKFAIFLLEKTAQVAADGIEAVFGFEIASQVGPVTSSNEQAQRDEKSEPEGAAVAGKVAEPGNTSDTASRENVGCLIRAAQTAAKLLRNLQNWLQSLPGQDPPICTESPSAVAEDRRYVVARKRVEELGLATRVFRGALYALTDTLDSIGVRASFLEQAKGTLHVSGDKSIDCSPVKEMSTLSPRKRKEFEESDEEAEDDEDELGTLEQLEKSYDSQDDEDYKPPREEELSTDSEEYKEGETESEESGQSEEEHPEDTLPNYRTDMPFTRSAAKAGSTVTSQTPSQTARMVLDPRSSETLADGKIAANSTPETTAGLDTKEPAFEASAEPPTQDPSSKTKASNLNGEEAKSFPQLGPAKKNLPVSARTP
ncbi:uncharacterized protein LOC110989113 [Acanthaster planci]|uniref:Uncharacterized protein LOC110989113 n=1 Tax=Acanthaster planci TaxID=133434 RepID=A0A8B7ZTQ5_ACAPL|nr:uncharacterized protein LOC110989113 [Acanthaster planci]